MRKKTPRKATRRNGQNQIMLSGHEQRKKGRIQKTARRGESPCHLCQRWRPSGAADVLALYVSFWKMEKR